MKLLISFTDTSNSFAHGVEFGRLLERMQRGEQDVANNGFPVRVENEDVIKQACEAYGYVYTLSPCKVEGWLNFMAIKNQHSLN